MLATPLWTSPGWSRRTRQPRRSSSVVTRRVPPLRLSKLLDMTSTGERTASLTAPGDSATAAALSVDALRSAAKALEGVAVQTPLLDIPALARRFGVPVAAKCEHLQPAGAFKIRGAYTAVSRIPVQDRTRGVITYSSGNHGQAVALAARLLGTHAVVVMPERAPAIKVAGVKRQGAEVVI